MKPLRIAALLVGSSVPLLAAVSTPLEIQQHLTPYNLQSPRGVPLSPTNNVPPGSDGRSPTQAVQTADDLTINPPTPGQFQTLTSFGGLPGLTTNQWPAVRNSPLLTGTNAFDATVAEAMQLPVGRALDKGPIVLVARRTQVGAPFLSRQVSFLFGSVIPVPDTDEYGLPLTNVVKEAYWLPEPFTTPGHTNAAYYWSPHARQAFAIQAGPIQVTWKKATPYTSAPAYTNVAGLTGLEKVPSFQTDGSIYLLYTAPYIISGSAVKPPRKMYWTEREFRSLGKAVAVPAARVGGVAIAYNNNFPKTVPTEYVGPGHTSPTDGTTNQPLPELRTLWYDQGQHNIYAYNQEGRVFLELLGDARPDGSRQHLGFEIVDVFAQPIPADVTIELGERLTPPLPGSLTNLFPEPVQQQGQGASFAYQHNVAGSESLELYATRETQNLNDYMVHWLEAGLQGLKWPSLFARYHLIWPTDVTRYSHYVRPAAATEAEARLTAVALATENVPTIAYQDPFDRPRAKLTEDFKFFTWLDTAYPAHRTLLRFTAGEYVAFERVFSWWDANLKTTNFTDSVAADLSAWNPTNHTVTWPDELTAPRVVSQTVEVGARLLAPGGEPGSGTLGATADYLAGHLNLSVGTSYNPGAYVDPLVVGFAAANGGAIIPVNAIPGTNSLEVWWFRTNSVNAGLNAANGARGFKPIYWPSVIGRYTLQWPASPREIVLASKRGSGTLDPLEALGTIYYRNDRTQDGYNPNEEHAIMSGGTAYATRDDLNITSGVGYSSDPFVLVDYQAQDGRPAMAAFKVLREKPSAGYVFDYVVEAGRPLQPPMPLPLLAKPVLGSGDKAVNYNTEPTGGHGDLPGGWTAHDATGIYSNYVQFTYRDRKHEFWVYRGLHAGLPALEVGTYDATNRAFVPRSNATAVVGQPFSVSLHVSRQDECLALTALNPPAWLSVQGLAIQGTPDTNHVATNSVQLVVEDLYDHRRVTNALTLAVLASGSAVGQAALGLSSTNRYTGSIVTFSNRPPFLALSPAPSNSFTMRYYYKTEPGFAWPGMANAPAAGSIVPYLRPWDSTNATWVGDAASADTASLEIVYRPVWPVRDPKDAAKPVPTLPFGATLTAPKFDLPGVRDFKTAHLLYQQSIAAHLPSASVSAVLHDPTREKYADLKVPHGVEKLPGGVKANLYQGKYYFPILPPHLATRLFLDPNRGEKGSLVLKGEFKDELLGEKYLLLNVLRGSDLAAAKALCPDGDPDKSKWDNLIDGLTTPVETFYEDPQQPGTYIPNPVLTVPRGVGELAVVTNDNTAVDSYALSATGPGAGYVTLLENSGTTKGMTAIPPSEPVAMHIFKVGGDELYVGETKVIAAANPLSEQVTFQHTADLAGRFDEYEYEWKIAAPVDGLPPLIDNTMSRYLALTNGPDVPRYTVGGAGIQALGDNYVVMRYRSSTNNTTHPLYSADPGATATNWSAWTKPALAEGWIKRVLAGINPFNQRVTDLFNNTVNTDASILTQAGHRWEGDVALNLDTINNYGLIEIYETVLRRGRMLSIESGYNYGPANDALLLAAGYLNDLYLMTGNEAWADAANPTIGIGTKDKTYGDIATALFAFKGQVPTLLEEDLALLRGRDDFLLPGVTIAPVYNRLVWNYTRGIDAGEVIYALNYNIQENPDQRPDGVINAADAARMFPQGHGDAYGHYLTALKGYYSLLINSKFDWVPRIEAVNVLGQPVSVDYQDERKFAAAAAAVARAGRQVFELVWRKDYQPVGTAGWDHFETTRVNSQREIVSGGVTNHTERYWGMDHWATRTGEGAYLNWVVGNALLPEIDPNPDHEGIQKVDRTTVPELPELTTLADGLQTALDNAEGGLSPLGLPQDALAFDLNPNAVVGTDHGTHFEQIYQRARGALNNAIAAFDDAKDVTRLMRSEQDSLADLQHTVARQELAYTNALIELYGTPYPDDIGAGKLYKQGYAGPDLVHYMYAELPEQTFPELWSYTEGNTFTLEIKDVPSDWQDVIGTSINFTNKATLEFNIGSHGFFEKPAPWSSRRASPGRIQQAISQKIAAHTRVRQAVNDAVGARNDVVTAINLFKSYVASVEQQRGFEQDLLIAQEVLRGVEMANDLYQAGLDNTKSAAARASEALIEALPRMLIVGLASGGDMTAPARTALRATKGITESTFGWLQFARQAVMLAYRTATATADDSVRFADIAPLAWKRDYEQKVWELGLQLGNAQGHLWTINQRLREREDADRNYRALVAEGDRLQQEREISRQRAAAVVQGFRTRDAAFRIFRNEKLERYKTLFDLAARYALLAANAYDYETGLLNTSAGRSFVGRIVNARALGVVRHGEPQFAGSNTGDPGLSSALAEMKADWDVLRGRLGFNNPDAYGTTVSLRTEALRILPGAEGDTNWKDVLQRAHTSDLLQDADVRRYCMQIGNEDGLPVPGFILSFSTTIAKRYNLFGQPLAAGDHAFSPSSFATKIFGVGVALEGYRGMDNPAANSGAVGGAGGTSPDDPSGWYLDPDALAATPYIYLIPVGVDSMRSPPLGDVSTVRTWMVDDVAIPMPFNIGASGFSTQPLWQSSDSLTEPLFALRKHQAFRPVSTTSVFSPGLYGVNGTLVRSQYTNNRLVGRSVWNSRWKIVIPGETLLDDPQKGMDRFIRTVRDVKLHFVTYSYSGN